MKKKHLKPRYDTLNVDIIMRKVKEEEEKIQKMKLPPVERSNNNNSQWCSKINSEMLLYNLYQAKNFSNIGVEIPEMSRFKGLKRIIALKVAKILLYLLKIITNPQRMFNELVLMSFKNVLNNFEQLEKSIDKELKMLDRELHSMKIILSHHGHLMSNVLKEVKKNMSEYFGKPLIDSIQKEKEHLLDDIYLSFEDEFRGTREEIKERLMVYLPFVSEIIAGSNDLAIIDIGCGRGEWLQILKENGYTAKGIEINHSMMQGCKLLGLDVVESDAIAYLKEQSPNSIVVITGFHIIEHLTFKRVVELLFESFRVLRSGGAVILETPNPENLMVGAYNFYIDPTHRNPIPPITLKFLFEKSRFSNIKILRMHANESQTLDNKLLQNLFFGPQDYAVVGYKI